MLAVRVGVAGAMERIDEDEPLLDVTVGLSASTGAMIALLDLAAGRLPIIALPCIVILLARFIIDWVQVLARSWRPKGFVAALCEAVGADVHGMLDGIAVARPGPEVTERREADESPELGCGQGFSTNLLAAANPHIRFHATDFNPGHIVGAQSLAQAGGSPQWPGFLSAQTAASSRLFSVPAIGCAGTMRS